MGTPIGQIAKKFLSPKNVSGNLFNLSPNSGKFPSNPVKKLRFSPSPNKQHFDTDLGVCSLENRNFNEMKIKIPNDFVKTLNKITFSPKKKQIPCISTPQKRNILNFGLIDNNWRILGRGNFGTVFQGYYKDEIVAVKVVSNKDSLLRETNCLQLKHPNVIDTIQIISEPGKDFGIIFMKYYKNSRNLQTILDDINIGLSKTKILKFASDISAGMKYCHENDIIHLDIKPLNILIGEDEICRICDFGNSVNLNCGEQTRNINLGTVYYTSPELFRGESPTTKCDIYSLGITFWQMEYRNLPYKNLDNKETIIYEVVKNNKRPEVSESSCDMFTILYKKCWNPNPTLRPDISQIVENINLQLQT